MSAPLLKSRHGQCAADVRARVPRHADRARCQPPSAWAIESASRRGTSRSSNEAMRTHRCVLSRRSPMRLVWTSHYRSGRRYSRPDRTSRTRSTPGARPTSTADSGRSAGQPHVRSRSSTGEHMVGSTCSPSTGRTGMLMVIEVKTGWMISAPWSARSTWYERIGSPHGAAASAGSRRASEPASWPSPATKSSAWYERTGICCRSPSPCGPRHCRRRLSTRVGRSQGVASR